MLRQLAEGVITVDEAEERLGRLDGGPVGDTERTREDGRRGRRRSVDDVIALAAHGVEADFLRALGEAGFHDLTTAEIIRLVDHGVEVNWLAAVPADVLGELGVDDLVALADHGVEPHDLTAFLGRRPGGEG